MGKYKGFLVFLWMVLLLVSCSNHKEQFQGKWHGERTGAGGHFYFFGNIEVIGDSVYFHSLPNEASFSRWVQVEDFDSVFWDIEWTISGDSLVFWNSEFDDSFSIGCYYCGKFYKGFLPNFPQHYLQNHMYGPFEVPIIAQQGSDKPLSGFQIATFDSIPIFIKHREALAYDSTTQVLPYIATNYGIGTSEDLRDWSANISSRQNWSSNGHRTIPVLFFFIAPNMPMEEVDAILLTVPVNCPIRLVYLSDAESTQFAVQPARTKQYLNMVQEHYRTTLPYFDIYDTLGPIPPFYFGPRKYPIIYHEIDTPKLNPIDVFLTSDQLFLGNQAITIEQLQIKMDSMICTSGLTPTVTLGFEGKATYGAFLEVYAILQNILANQSRQYELDYYPLDVYRTLRPDFRIERF